MSTDFSSEIQNEIGGLSPDALRPVLQYVRSRKQRGAGPPGKMLLGFAGSISTDDLERMQTAIESGCEQVDVNEW